MGLSPLGARSQAAPTLDEPILTIRPSTRWTAQWSGQPRTTALAVFALLVADIALQVTVSESRGFFRIYLLVLILTSVPLSVALRRRMKRVAGIRVGNHTIARTGIRGTEN